MYLVCARTETRGAGHGEGRTEHSTESLIAFPFPITMLISLPYFGPLVVNKPAQKFYVGAVRGHVRSYLKWRNGGRGGGAGRKSCMPYEYRLPTTVPASRSSQSRPLRVGSAVFVVFICGLAVHPGWCDLRPGFAADANLKGEMRQHYAMISGWTRSLSSR